MLGPAGQFPSGRCRTRGSRRVDAGSPWLVVRGGEVVSGSRRWRADVAINAGRIVGVGPSVDAPLRVPVLDAGGLQVASGFVDLQCNGGHGIDLATEPERLWELAALLPRHGVTAWLPTIISTPADVPVRAMAALRRTAPPRVARPLGLHLEGPMLNPACAGAHPPGLLRPPGPDVYAGWSRTAGVALVTLAPELPGALDAVATLVARRVVVAAGHTAASADEVALAAERGITYVTHLANAMTPFRNREPGPVGATLADERLVAGLIVDGVHLHPVTVAAMWRALGPDRTNLVSDAVAALGLPPGRTHLGDAEVVVSPDDVRLGDGTLAGSKAPLDRVVRNLVAFTGCTIADAVATVTSTPARVLGLARRLAPGGPGDLTLLDEHLHVAATVVGGRLAHLVDASRLRR